MAEPTRSVKKIILLFVTVSLLIAAGIGYYWYNKPPVDVQQVAGVPVTALDLYAHFISDSAAAKKTYGNKVLEVSGTVTRISENQDQQAVVLLKTNNGDAAINCTMEAPVGDLSSGQQIVVKGICGGMGEGDQDLGIPGDVYLLRCYLIK